MNDIKANILPNYGDGNRISLFLVEEKKDGIGELTGLLSDSSLFNIANHCQDKDRLLANYGVNPADIVLLDIDNPLSGGLKTCENLTLEYPEADVIILSSMLDPKYICSAMAAGAKDFLIKPVNSKDLAKAIVNAYEKKVRRQILAKRAEQGAVTQGKVIALFSTKGGTGKSTVAVNLAIAIKKLTGQKVALGDMNLQFGDIAVLMNIKPDLEVSGLTEEEKIYDDILGKYLVRHESGILVLPPPMVPQHADKFNSEHIRAIIENMRLLADWIVLDTSASFRNIELTVLDLADMILMITTPEITSLKDSKLSLNVMKTLEYPDEKIWVILNRSDETMGITHESIEETLQKPIKGHIPSDGSVVIPAMNRGKPFIMDNGKEPIKKAIMALGAQLTGSEYSGKSGKKGLLSSIRRLLD